MFHLAVPCILTKRALSLPIHKNQSDKSDKVEVVIAATPSQQRLEFTRTAIDGEGPKIALDVTQGAANIANQFDHVVFADVHHMQNLGLAREDFPGHRLADGAGAADHQEGTGARPALVPGGRLHAPQVRFLPSVVVALVLWRADRAGGR